MAIAQCTKCGCDFERDEAWKPLCLPCWKKENRPKKSSGSGTPDELARLHLKVLVLEQQVRAYQLFQRPAPRIEPEMLRRLTMLCHPDRHGNSEASTKATAFLLGMRV